MLLISSCQKKINFNYILTISMIFLQSMQSCTFISPKCFAIDFFESMRAHSRQFDLEYAGKKPEAVVFKALYDQFIIKELEYRQEPRIPKIIHQIWLGSKLPRQYVIWQQTWIKQHPDWQYKLWMDTDIEKLDLVNKQLYAACNSYGAKSDIARYEILYRFGGLYVDCDFECLQPFDLFHHCCDFYASCDNAEEGRIIRITNALIGVKPYHPIMKLCIEKIKQRPVGPIIGAEQVIALTGPGLLTKCFFESSGEWDGPCVIFPASYFIPLPWSARFIDATSSNEQVKRWIKPESYAIHFWHGSWTNYAHKFKPA